MNKRDSNSACNSLTLPQRAGEAGTSIGDNQKAAPPPIRGWREERCKRRVNQLPQARSDQREPGIA
jgi:hypothetical protein